MLWCVPMNCELSLGGREYFVHLVQLRSQNMKPPTLHLSLKTRRSASHAATFLVTSRSVWRINVQPDTNFDRAVAARDFAGYLFSDAVFTFVVIQCRMKSAFEFWHSYRGESEDGGAVHSCSLGPVFQRKVSPPSSELNVRRMKGVWGKNFRILFQSVLSIPLESLK